MVFTGTPQQFFPGFGGNGDVPRRDPGPAALGLEGAFRAGHFEGVATVVERLFELVRPDRAYFGAKDFQQSLVVRDLARALGGPEVVVCPTVREADGLALSSRNLLLDAESRRRALALSGALERAREAWRGGERDADRLCARLAEALAEPGIGVEYAEVRDPEAWTAERAARGARARPGADRGAGRWRAADRQPAARRARLTAPSESGVAAGGWVRALAPAKVNPWLEVLGRRDDGFHELDMWMLCLDWCDVVSVRCVEGGSIGEHAIGVELEGASADVPADQSNLAARGARIALDTARARGDERGLVVRVEKRVPSRAGLGGGSADAVAACLAAERALGVELADRERSEALARVGSDCPFFADARGTGFARCRGRGERVAPYPAVDGGWSVAVVVPELECPTARVYGALDPTSLRARGGAPFNRDLFGMDEADLRAGLFNRLEAAALSVVPALRSWRDLLSGEGAGHFRLSGSGSAFFGVFRDPEGARATLERLSGSAAAAGLGVRATRVARPLGTGAAFAR